MSIRCILLAVALPVALYAQVPDVPRPDTVRSHHKLWAATYDEVRDSTRVRYYGISVLRNDSRGPSLADPANMWGQVGIGVQYDVRGRSAAIPDSVELEFTSMGPSFPPDTARTLALLIDDSVRVSARVATYHREHVMDYAIEEWWFRVPRRTFLRLSTARSAKAVIGPDLRFAFTSEALDDLRKRQAITVE